jgi:hypothetical protein
MKDANSQSDVSDGMLKVKLSSAFANTPRALNMMKKLLLIMAVWRSYFSCCFVFLNMRIMGCMDNILIVTLL